MLAGSQNSSTVVFSYSPLNLQQNPCHSAHHTLDVLLHYLAKDERPKVAKFCFI